MLIDSIHSPADLKKLGREELRSLAQELRDVIIGQVSCEGGHLASNLGVVELTIALHYVFNAPRDKIIWDVGHQAYPHKLITGRYNMFTSLRKFRGISGFPRIDESPYDAFGTGHSSTSISAALGIIEARDRTGEDYKVAAVIGDGAMTSGLAFEGLNHAGQLKKDIIVILNDNEMSIGKNVGALSAYLNRILTGEAFQKFKRETKAFLENIPRIGSPMSRVAQKAEGTLKGFFLPGMLFEELGFNYIGPIDGHDIDLLIDTFTRIRSTSQPLLLHVITKKGKGYHFSEDNPCAFHGVGPFDLGTGAAASVTDAGSPTYSDVFGEGLQELARDNPRIIAISAAMREGTGLESFAQKYPDRFYDVGIAEPHAVTFAAGLASQGMRPVVAIYSTFLQRAYDQIAHDVCLQGLPVVFAIDRSGIVGEDGATHQGLLDISFLRHLPNLVFMAPKDGAELRHMLRFALSHSGPCAIRYPRGKTPRPLRELPHMAEMTLGTAEVMRDGSDVAIIAVGPSVYQALKTADALRDNGISASVLNARFIKPLDEQTILSLAEKTRRIVTVEENLLAGGFGSAILECLSRTGMSGVSVKMVGINDTFVEHGSQAVLRKKYGLDSEGIYKIAKACFSTLHTCF